MSTAKKPKKAMDDRQLKFEDLPELVGTPTAAAFLGVSQSFLKKDRLKTGKNLIPFITLATKTVRYHKQTLLEFSQRIKPAA
jgi:hypothetical protein